MYFEKMLHGGDYNPEQWLDCPEVLEEDIELMKKSHVNVVSLGIFSWATLEPEEDKFEFGWLEDIIDKLYDNGVYTVLATPTGSIPKWLSAKYPEVLMTAPDGTRNHPGKRHNYCPSSPVMRARTKVINEKLATMSKNHSGVIMWHISNEIGGNDLGAACYCENCQNKFREWLKEKYGTLDKLNHEWWTTFWGRTYTDWKQVEAPMPNGEDILHGLSLDWRRFCSDLYYDFMSEEIDAVKAINPVPATTNFMFFFEPLNSYQFAKKLDVVSWDSYPSWHKRRDEVPVAVKTAACHSMMRAIKKEPFVLMESAPSMVNWKECNIAKRPGMHMLSSMQAVAHGSNTVQYFQWRKGRGASEKFHSAVVDHLNGENTRTFRDVTSVGMRLEKLCESRELLESVNKAQVAMIFDWDNMWAIQNAFGPKHYMDYKHCLWQHFRSFWEAGIDVDLIGMDEDFSGYQILVAPMNYMYKKGYPAKVRSFVENGGTYVTTYYSGVVDESDLCFTGKHPLIDVLGVEPEEIEGHSKEEFPNYVKLGKTNYSTGEITQVVQGAGARVLFTFEADYVKGMPAVTVHRLGKGCAYYLAAEFEQEFLNKFYEDRLKERSIKNPLGIKLPYGVTIAKRSGSKDFIFVMNFNNEEVPIKGFGKYIKADTKEKVKGAYTLAPFECLILTEK